MKKLLALLLAVAMLTSMATIVSAAESTTTKSTTVTLNVPAASYTLDIPETAEIPFGQTETIIGDISVTDGQYFASGKNVKVTVNYDAFSSQATETTIPFTLSYASMASKEYGTDPYTQVLNSGESVLFYGRDDGTVYPNAWYDSDRDLESDYLVINILTADMNAAPAGEYTATITFNAEIYSENYI